MVKKHPGGRPPLFETAIELQNKIDEYFEIGCKEKEIIVGKGATKKIVKVKIPTISGLCYFLGFESRQSFYDYDKKLEFTYTIKRARLFIEVEYEEQLNSGNTIGAIFALKNFGWTDKQEVEHSGNKEKPLFPENKMSSDKIKSLINEKIKRLKK